MKIHRDGDGCERTKDARSALIDLNKFCEAHCLEINVRTVDDGFEVQIANAHYGGTTLWEAAHNAQMWIDEDFKELESWKA